MKPNQAAKKSNDYYESVKANHTANQNTMRTTR